MPNLPLSCPGPYCFTAIFMDAGQGDATLLVYPDNSLVLVDCGCRKNKGKVVHEIGTVLDAYLRRTDYFLKALVLTHPDQDHYNLIDELLINNGVRIGTLMYGGSSRDYGHISDWVRAGDDWLDDVWYFNSGGYFEHSPNPELSFFGNGAMPDVEVRILSANIGDRHVKADANPNSVVLLVTFLDVNLFLMGDATKATENFIMDVNARNLELSGLLANRHTVLKAGHHGSNSSSGRDWVELINPKIVFISSDTLTFNGTSIPRSSVIDGIRQYGDVVDLGTSHHHYYVQYNDQTTSHEEVPTTDGMFTTLHRLDLDSMGTGFVSYGTSWYYTVTGYPYGTGFEQGDIYITPAMGWDDVNHL